MHINNTLSRAQKMEEWVLRLSILPILLVSEGFFFYHVLYYTSWCSGTLSGYFETMAICQITETCTLCDLLVMNPLILILWMAGSERDRWVRPMRIISLIYLWVLRIIPLWSATYTQTTRFFP